MTQNYQNYRCHIKRTDPKSPTLPYMSYQRKYDGEIVENRKVGNPAVFSGMLFGRTKI
jgi:hypothetical protein